MTKRIKQITLILGIFTLISFCNNNPIQSSIPFSASYFSNPQMDPMRGWHFKNTQVAVIPFIDSTVLVQVVWGIDSTNQNQYWLESLRSDSSSTFSMLSFIPNSENRLSCEIQFRPYMESGDTYALQLQLLNSAKVLLYKWSGKETISLNQISVPVVKTSPIVIGQKMPQYPLMSLSDGSINSKKFKNHIVVINWWSIGCVPCIKEMPALNKMVEKYQSKNVEFIAIGWNSASEISNFLKEKQFLYQQFVHVEKDDSLFGSAFPRNIIIDSQGAIAYDRIGGSVNGSIEMEEVLNKLLSSK